MECEARSSDSYRRMLDAGLLQERRRYIRDWNDFQRFVQEQDGWKRWMFRGQSDWRWEPESSLRREAERQAIPDIVERELGLIRRFKREYSQYRGDHPAEDDYIQWMSIMRHFGAPTRLLDITYSPYVALFFAAIDAASAREAAVWCFNSEWMDESYKKRAPRRYKRELHRDRLGVFVRLWKVVLNDRTKKVYTLNPFRMSTRLVRQQGGFLLPTDVEDTFMSNLAEMSRAGVPGPAVVKVGLQLDASALKEIFLGLYRMNVSAATLLPGLSGFAGSLKMIMSHKHLTESYTLRFD